jgi:hypothetical protein
MINVETQREIKKNIVDGATGATVCFHFRRPTNKEQQAYDRAVAKGKVANAGLRVRSAAQKLVKPLVCGISMPDPELALAWERDGQLVELSSDPKDPGYRQDYLAVIEAFSPGMLKLLGVKIFAGETEDQDIEDEEAEALPNS